MISSAIAMSDAESLIERQDEEPVQRSLNRKRVGVFAGALFMMGAVAAFVFRRPTSNIFAQPSEVVGLSVLVPEGCFKQGMFYLTRNGGKSMPGGEQTLETSAAACQARCAEFDSCRHFTYWPSGGCLLTGKNAYLKASGTTNTDVVVGPKSCDDVFQYEAEGPASNEFCDDEPITSAPSSGPIDCQMRCDSTPDCEYYGLWLTGGKNWCQLTATCDTKGEQNKQIIQVYKKLRVTATEQPTIAAVAPAPIVTASATVAAGINGTQCSAYPACVAAGIKEGPCCPNLDNVALGCCDGFPPAPVVSSIVTGPASQPGPVSEASCSLAPECAKLKLEGNCCPNDVGSNLGCCPGGGTPVAQPLPDVAADSIQKCDNNPVCKEAGLLGLCCPVAAGVSLGCCESEQVLEASPPPPVLLPPASTPGPLMTFYMYRVDNDQQYALNGVNMANLNGDTWYLHNEVVISCPRKFGITRLTRFLVTYRATKQLYGQSKNFDSFVAFDKAKCTVPGCASLHWNPLGYVVGCSPNDKGRVALPGDPVWYSLPGTCPSKFYFQKTAECNLAEPGGNCNGKDVTGDKTCTYNVEQAGEIRLDELSGIQDYNGVCATTGQREYDEATDKGTGTSFWNGKSSQAAGDARISRIEKLFAKKFPQWPAHLDDPPCDAM